MDHDLTIALRSRTAHIIAARFHLENQRRADQMARLIEIKGLGADIAAVKKGIGELRAAATELNTEKSGLTAEIKDLTEQLKQHRTDLRFEAETLGNSSGDTDEEETKKPPAGSPGASVVTPDKISALAEAAKKYDETVVTVNLSTDRDIAEGAKPVTTERVALGPHPDQPEVAEGASQTFRAAE